MKYTSRPYTVEAIVWEGGDTWPLTEFLGSSGWTRADAVDLDPVAGLEFGSADSEQVVVWDGVHACWNPCPVGFFIVKGPLGNFFPLSPAAFVAAYEPVKTVCGFDMGDWAFSGETERMPRKCQRAPHQVVVEDRETWHHSGGDENYIRLAGVWVLRG